MPASTATSSTMTRSPGWGERLRRASGALVGGFRKPTCYVGIDIGMERVQFATLLVNPRSRRQPVRWLSQHRIALPPVDSGSWSNWGNQLNNALSEQLPRCVRSDNISAVVSLPQAWIHYQTSTVKTMDSVRHQCDEVFRRSVFQSPSHLTHWPIDGESVNDPGHYQIAAVADEASCQVADAISQIGYQVTSMVPHGLALVHAATATTSLRPAAAILLDREGGLVSLATPRGCGLTRTISPPVIDPNQHLVAVRDLAPWLERAADEFASTVRFNYRLSSSIDADAPILLAGGLSGVRGVDVEMARLIGRPVAVWQSTRLERPRSLHGDQDGDADRAVSVSLATLALSQSRSKRSQQRVREAG